MHAGGFVEPYIFPFVNDQLLVYPQTHFAAENIFRLLSPISVSDKSKVLTKRSLEKALPARRELTRSEHRSLGAVKPRLAGLYLPESPPYWAEPDVWIRSAQSRLTAQ